GTPWAKGSGRSPQPRAIGSAAITWPVGSNSQARSSVTTAPESAGSVGVRAAHGRPGLEDRDTVPDLSYAAVSTNYVERPARLHPAPGDSRSSVAGGGGLARF